jgi:hypothetical protein
MLKSIAESYQRRTPALPEDVQDLRLARSHFEIRREDSAEGTARYLVRDLNSHCGTPINDCNIGDGWHELSHGDRLLFNMFEFRCEP